MFTNPQEFIESFTTIDEQIEVLSDQSQGPAAMEKLALLAQAVSQNDQTLFRYLFLTGTSDQQYDLVSLLQDLLLQSYATQPTAALSDDEDRSHSSIHYVLSLLESLSDLESCETEEQLAQLNKEEKEELDKLHQLAIGRSIRTQQPLQVQRTVLYPRFCVEDTNCQFFSLFKAMLSLAKAQEQLKNRIIELFIKQAHLFKIHLNQGVMHYRDLKILFSRQKAISIEQLCELALPHTEEIPEEYIDFVEEILSSYPQISRKDIVTFFKPFINTPQISDSLYKSFCKLYILINSSSLLKRENLSSLLVEAMEKFFEKREMRLYFKQAYPSHIRLTIEAKENLPDTERFKAHLAQNIADNFAYRREEGLPYIHRLIKAMLSHHSPLADDAIEYYIENLIRNPRAYSKISFPFLKELIETHPSELVADYLLSSIKKFDPLDQMNFLTDDSDELIKFFARLYQLTHNEEYKNMISKNLTNPYFRDILCSYSKLSPANNRSKLEAVLALVTSNILYREENKELVELRQTLARIFKDQIAAEILGHPYQSAKAAQLNLPEETRHTLLRQFHDEENSGIRHFIDTHKKPMFRSLTNTHKAFMAAYEALPSAPPTPSYPGKVPNTNMQANEFGFFASSSGTTPTALTQQHS